MRWDSPVVLAIAGTLAIHLLVLVGADAVVVIYPRPPIEIAPRLELVEIEVPPVVKPPPPPIPKEPEPEPPPPVEPPKTPPPPQAIQPAPRPVATPPPVAEPPPTTTAPDPGGAPVVSMPDIAPSASGVAVATGPRTTGAVGRGGQGRGTGAGSGEGSAAAPPTPVSVATIKTRALPRGDYGYFDAGKDYPAEARALGVEGVIRVRLVVDAAGKVASAVLLNKLGHGLDELAMTRARQIEFDPAKDTDDKPVSSVVVWTFNMTLPK